MLNINGCKRVFQNIILFKSLFFNAACELRKKGIGNGVRLSGEQAGNRMRRGLAGRGFSAFEVLSAGVGSVIGPADNLPDTVLYFLACGSGIALINNSGNSRD